jgi:integrase/recombinase XerD
MLERGACPQGRRCDFLLVNLFREPLGAPIRPKALNELLAGLSRRAGLPRVIHPHQLRHSMATNVAAAGGTLDEIRELLGHAAITSSQVYLHPSPDRLRMRSTALSCPARIPAKCGDDRGFSWGANRA